MKKFTSISHALLGIIVLFSCCVPVSGEQAPPQIPQPATETPAKFVSDRMAVEVIGAGADVVLLPGFGSSREVWRPLSDALAPRYRVHLVQYAGFAGEPWKRPDDEFVQPLVEELARYIQESHIKDPALIGHSMGGMISMLLAQQHPQLIGRIMSIDSLPRFPALVDANIMPDEVQGYAQRVADFMLAADEASFYKNQLLAAGTMTRTRAMRETIIDWVMASDRGALAAALKDLITLDLRPGLAAMTTPVWVVYAADAKAGNAPEKATALWQREYKSLPNAKFTLVEDSRHFIMADQPEKLEKIVNSFLTEK